MKSKAILTLILFLIIVPMAFASIEDYVANLDTSYYDGTLNITSFQDRIIDANSNGINDTLFFNLTTDYNTSANYTALIYFEDLSLPVLSDTRLISSSNPSFYMNLHFLSYRGPILVLRKGL